MTKTDRINTMMRYINNRQFFTISELMRHFQVSRSTVIRDLNQIQELGMPLTASVGRDGGYAVLQNQLLPAVQFNSEELKALFVSFLATLNTQLPYLQNRNTLTEKLVAIASQTQQDDLLTLQELLVFSHTNPANTKLTELTDFAPPMLKQLLNTCLTSRQLQLTTAAGSKTVWVNHLFNRRDNWYIDAWDFAKRQSQELKVADIKAVTPVTQTVSSTEIRAAIKATRPAPNVTLTLSASAIQQFRQHPHPTVPLQFLDPFQQTAKLTCYLEVTEATTVNEFARWYLYLGSGAQLTAAPAPVIAAIQSECLAQLEQLPSSDED